MAIKYTSNIQTTPLKVSGGPVDIRTVVEYQADLMSSDLSKYVGLVVYVIEDSQLYVCIKTGRTVTTLEQGWKVIGGSDFKPEDAATKIIESSDSLTSITFAYPGMMVFVDGDGSEDGELYILTRTPASDIENWKVISGSTTINEGGVIIDRNIDSTNAPEGVSLSTDRDTVVEDYINSENTIKAGKEYTSNGILSTGESNLILDGVEYIDIYPASGDGSSYIRLYKDGENWATIVDDGSLGISPSVTGDVAKGDAVSFGEDVDFTEWNVRTSDGGNYIFGNEVGYDDIDIFSENELPVAYINVNGVVERVLTETDKTELDEKINNMGDSIMVTLNAGDSDAENDEQVTIQQAINNITNNINKMEMEIIPDSDIEGLFE